MSLNHSFPPCLGMHVDRAPARYAHPKCQICETELRPGSSFERGFSPQDYHEHRPDGPAPNKPYPRRIVSGARDGEDATKNRRNGSSEFNARK